mgnify:CR=1 FL=1
MEKNKIIMYKSPFRGWVEITPAQKEKLIKHMQSGIIAMSGKRKESFIDSKFKTVEN